MSNEIDTKEALYILSLRWTRTEDESATWWRADNNGYTTNVDQAGRYTRAQVQQNPSYYDNRETTLAVPCELVDRRAQRVVPSDALSAIVTDAIGVPTLVTAPREESPDDPRPLECPTCGQERSTRPGQSRLVPPAPLPR